MAAYTPVPRVFAAISLKGGTKLRAALQAKFPGDYYEMSPAAFLFVAGGTAKEVSTFLGVSNKEFDETIVFLVSDYWGMASPEIWSWLASRSTRSA